MTIQISDTQDFIQRLKSLMDAHASLKESGIDLTDPVFGSAVVSFLDQFDLPASTPPSIGPTMYVIRDRYTRDPTVLGSHIFDTRDKAQIFLDMKAHFPSKLEIIEVAPVDNG